MEEALRRLEAAAAGWGVVLSRGQLDQARRYVEYLLSRVQKTNLTAEKDPQRLILRHLADGMAAAAVLRPRLSPEPKIADLGAGAGFIGIGLKIAWPQADVTLLEAVERKYRFLNSAVLVSGLKGLHVLLRKATVGSWNGPAYEAVTARAVAPCWQVVKLAAPLLRPGGLLLNYQSQAPQSQEPSLQKALAAAGARLVESIPYQLPAESRERFFALFAFQGGS